MEVLLPGDLLDQIITQNKERINGCLILQSMIKCQQGMSKKPLSFCSRGRAPILFEIERNWNV